MSELPKIYQPENYEDAIYQKWEESGYFNPDNLPGKRTKKYSVAMPPPNVTGVLHLGHALENSLMDIAVRYHRLRGEKTLLVPGTDHAAVATQARVEKDLIKNKGLKNPRAELGRAKLLQIIRDYAENSREIILGQIRKLGTSCDWSRLAYTFDEERGRAVNEAFVKMYKDDLIYRGYRPVNWSVKGQSTCSDDEVVRETRQTVLYTFKYAKDFPIAIASTQPETKLGDTAVAVHPDDKRYRQFIGQTCQVNVGAARPLAIKIIADQSIDQNFGTGAMGVTPAHSLVDYDLSLKHGLALVQVIGADGKMTAKAGQNYQGLSTLAAREKFVRWLKDNDLLIKEEAIEQNVGVSDRFGDVIEVLPMTQWFVAVNKKIPGRNKTLKQLMKEAVGSKAGQVKITPERFVKTYFQWIDNLRDWCISRQIWWGHRLPVWYKSDQVYVGLTPPSGSGSPRGAEGEAGWQQDEDTLDTWFSSSLWTFSTLGWPDKTKDLKEFHPTSWMQMGYEILFFWLARMILMSSYLLKQLPFKQVYIHGILRNKEGHKFSKSLGTGIDPLEVIRDYGADALRLSMIMGITPGNDAKFYYEKVEGARNFVNKLWNISRYILNQKSEDARTNKNKKLTLADQWIQTELNLLVQRITQALDDYQFSQAAELLYEFTWSKFADWYLETAKIEGPSAGSGSGGKEAILLSILEKLLILWHPFCPFVTEAIWSEMGRGSMLIISKWPKALVKKHPVSRDFVLIQQAVTAIRNVRSERQISPKEILTCSIKTSVKAIKENLPLLAGLAGVKVMPQTLGVTVNSPKVEMTLAIQQNAELDKKRAAEATQLRQYIEVQKRKLANQDFCLRAPQQVINKEKEKLAEAQEKLKKLL